MRGVCCFCRDGPCGVRTSADCRPCQLYILGPTGQTTIHQLAAAPYPSVYLFVKIIGLTVVNQELQGDGQRPTRPCFNPRDCRNCANAQLIIAETATLPWYCAVHGVLDSLKKLSLFFPASSIGPLLRSPCWRRSLSRNVRAYRKDNLSFIIKQMFQNMFMTCHVITSEI